MNEKQELQKQLQRMQIKFKDVQDEYEAIKADYRNYRYPYMLSVLTVRREKPNNFLYTGLLRLCLCTNGRVRNCA